VSINTIRLHPEFPYKVWVVVEQPRDDVYRFTYNPADETFSRSNIRSLMVTRGFRGVYGWVGGTGLPPAPHHDVLLVTGQSPSCGDILTGHIVGVFLRKDKDHKFVAVDDEIRQGMPDADLVFLDKAHYNELLNLYPRIDEGEGWYGKDVAISHLQMMPLHD
jgi:hypothetical protein